MLIDDVSVLEKRDDTILYFPLCADVL